MTLRPTTPRLVFVLFGATLAALALLLATPTVAVTFASAVWRLDSNTAPSQLVAGSEARLIASASNLGDATVLGDGAHAVTLTDKLPANLRVPAGVQTSAIEGKLETSERSEAASFELICSIEEAQRKEVRCSTTPDTQPLAPYTQLRVTIPVEADAGAATGEMNSVSLSGGEPETRAEQSRPIAVENAPTPFGVERYEVTPENEDGSVDVQAGSHPYQLSTALDLNETLAPESQGAPELEPSAPALTRNLSLELPPGLLGDPQAVTQCPDVDFASIGENDVNSCPADSAIGVALVTLNLASPPLGVFTEAVPVFNLVPAPGEPARFGFEDTKVPIILDTSVRTDGDYGVDVTVRNTTQAAQLLSSRVTLWGEPENENHDASRGWACLRDKTVNGESCSPPGEPAIAPFLTLPTSCLGAISTQINAEAWNTASSEAEFTFQSNLGEPLSSLQDCEAVAFNPTLDVEPTQAQVGEGPGGSVTSASTPAGLDVGVSLPSEEHGLGESAVRSTTVTLPAGVQLSPSDANGLQACSEAQIGYEGAGNAADPFSPGAGEPLRFSPAPATCPEASKVALVHIKSPDLSHELEGGAYIAQQTSNPFGSLFALYIVAEDPALGIRVKLAGQVSLSEETGQITSTFSDTPQVPFEALRLQFFEGDRAATSTPPLCGSYSTLASFTPWSSPTALLREAAFQITSGPEGQPCANPLPFDPGLKAGSSSPQAGAFTSFNLTLTNPDADQRLRAVSVHLPAGIAAILASVTPCPEPQAGEAQCGLESLIGHTLASAGYGPEPYELPGEAYLTGPYEGAPFGIEVVTPAVAGPFNLGTVTVRSRIEVDPHTAAVTITSDPIPLLVKGVPAQIKQLQVTVDRPDFQFNPTSCRPATVTSTLTGDHGATANPSYPYDTHNCASLPFDPGVNAGTLGKTSKADGASLGLTFKSKEGEAHVAKTILTIPATLPARLTTIQKACVASVFEANPASCPEGSVIGTATVHTPVLRNPVTGPIYLVSHGNAAWPDAELVLQGEGITVILDGQTAIKKGVTTSSFLSVPDVPFEKVEAMLPEGPHSALTTNLPLEDHYSLCGHSLTIPTALTGQNGTAVSESVAVAIQGCHAVRASKTKKLRRAQKLVRALEACRKRHRHSHAKRISCERLMRRRYASGGKAARRARNA
ncbi:MAG TPA: hypothetical protein VMB51_08005 [Solirubrobacteraceae bacterium]|nr:hypothetical protein [Solirubrobacteraceae bacterium]